MFASLDRLAKEGWRFEIEHQPNDGFYISAIKADFNETPANKACSRLIEGGRVLPA